jgi:hypothetical protein
MEPVQFPAAHYSRRTAPPTFIAPTAPTGINAILIVELNSTLIRRDGRWGDLIGGASSRFTVLPLADVGRYESVTYIKYRMHRFVHRIKHRVAYTIAHRDTQLHISK